MPDHVRLPEINGFLQKEVAWGQKKCLDQTASWSPMQFMGLILFFLISGQHQGTSPSRLNRDMQGSVAISAEVIGSLKITQISLFYVS